MAATKAQQRRYQAGLRRVLAWYRAEDPDRYRVMLTAALADIDAANPPQDEQPVDDAPAEA